MTKYIKAPFNFVPLSEKVIKPEWADNISHVIPFEDGMSGKINVILTAQTPIFVRNGHTREEHEAVVKGENYKSFSKHGDQYFLPATSIKGMIRNALEILSFGKMNRVSDDRYAYRDLYDNYYKEIIIEQKDKKTNKDNPTFCGWLDISKDGSIVKVIDLGKPGRISHREIDKKFEKGFVATFSDSDILRKDANRTSKYKYSLLNNKLHETEFLVDKEKNESKPSVDTRDFYFFSKENSDNAIKGTLVLTGQPGARKRNYKNEWIGKFYEFVFFEKANPIIHSIDPESPFWKDFLFINKHSEDWKFLLKQFPGKIPVFFKKDSNGKIANMGISYLYKLPYQKRITDCLPAEHKLNNNIDFAEVILGNVRKKLKGRVQFGHAFLKGEAQPLSELKPLMGSPKPSYYPIYLEQKGSNGFLDGRYITYMNSNARLKGWKKYPVHQNAINSFSVEKNQEKNISPFKPLPTGSKFTFAIHYHNLKKVELGAILYSLTMGNQKDVYHNIGFAKPYGYGKVKLELDDIRTEFHEYMNEFEQMMENDVNGWKNSTQLKELFLMSKNQNNREMAELSYMALTDFPAMKRSSNRTGEVAAYFELYSEKLDANKTAQSFKKKETIAERITPTKNYPPLNQKPDKPVTKNDLLKREEISEPNSTQLEAKFLDNKTVHLVDQNIDVQLVIPKEKRNVPLKEGMTIYVIIKQMKNDGQINQVSYVGLKKN